MGAQPVTKADALYPTWLLMQPLKLPVRNNAPQCAEGGPLTLLAGPQRVEAGWWGVGDDMGVGSALALRDYFLVRSAHMGLLWIYRERLGGQGSQSRAGSMQALTKMQTGIRTGCLLDCHYTGSSITSNERAAGRKTPISTGLPSSLCSPVGLGPGWPHTT